jgi:hypothetical protein
MNNLQNKLLSVTNELGVIREKSRILMAKAEELQTAIPVLYFKSLCKLAHFMNCTLKQP